MKTGEEFRRFSRYPIRVEFKIHEDTETSKGKLLFDSLNLSAGGAFLHSDYLFDVGSDLDVSFKLPNNDEPIHVKAKVTWVTRGSTGRTESGMGVEFINLEASDRATIEALIQSYPKLPG